MEPGIPGRIPSIRPIRINRMTKNATAAHTCAPSPKQSTRDLGARGAIWAHIQILLSRNL